ncbi:LysR substrate-binding domain-containing protein [Georgenia deserti]|uniref:LysR substrate-binding domain-containing protein n=1 Tax=Georgenia deserti TaxID=2093781 RepID=A0ABW4L656_9MICO
MELHQCRYVLAVAETGGFTRAAERCFVAQSALSHQIAKLERELGVTLFARSSRRVELTQAGAAFLPWARECLAAAERAVSEAADAAGEVRGRLTVGVIPTVAAVDIPELLQRFRDRYPAVRVALTMGASQEMTERVAGGRLDAAFLGLPEVDEPVGVGARELARDDLVAVLSPGHRLGTADHLSLAQIADEVFVDFPAGSPGRSQSDLAFAAAGLARDVAFEVSTADLFTGLIRQGLAVGLLPASFIGPRGEGLLTVPVDDGPRRVEYLVWSDFNPSPALRAFLGEVDRLSPVS